MNIFDWLKENGYDYTWNFKLGGKLADIIAFNKNEIVAFEVKKSAREIPTAVGQCMHYLEDANKSYVILPSKETNSLTKSSMALLKKLGIGLLQDEKNVKILLEAKRFSRSNKHIIEKLKEKSISGPRLNVQTTKEEKEKEIIEILKKHPEGLMIVSIGKELNLHRNTVSKYIFGLVMAGIVTQRRIGVVSLCYLNEAVRKAGGPRMLGKSSKAVS